MSFPAETGVLTPADFKIIHNVYRKVSAERWFARSADRQEQFALTVIDAYRQGRTDPEELLDYCRDVAMQRFGEATASRRHTPHIVLQSQE